MSAVQQEGNANPPNVIKRKKNRDKKHSLSQTPTSKVMVNNEYNVPANFSYFQNSCTPDIPNYYPFINYHTPLEPLSLPVYPAYPMSYHNLYGASKNMLTVPVQNSDQEYLSLPVPCEANGEIGGSKVRRYSDPGLPNDSDSSGESYVDDNTIKRLIQQVNMLKDSNRKMYREMQEMRLEINMLKQQQQQQLVQQQNSRHFEREYEPGMLAEVIKEVRDAARVREDALLARVKHMIEEKHFTMNQLHLVNEKSRHNDRIQKLEDQLKNMTFNNGGSSRSEDFNNSLTLTTPSSIVEDTGGSARQVIELEREALTLRRELQEARAARQESDHKLLQLDKLVNLLRSKDPGVDVSGEGSKTPSSVDAISTVTSSPVQIIQPRVTLSGPVTDL